LLSYVGGFNVSGRVEGRADLDCVKLMSRSAKSKVEMAIVNVESFTEVLLRDGSIWIVKDLSPRTIVFEALPNSVWESPTRVHLSEKDINECIAALLARKTCMHNCLWKILESEWSTRANAGEYKGTAQDI